MHVPPHFLVIVPGFMGSKLRSKQSGKTVWVDFSTLPINPLEWDDWLNTLFDRIAYPNDDLEPAGIMDEVMFLPPWAKQEHYGRLLSLLEGMGYCSDTALHSETDRNVYQFAYDWRQDNRLSAQQLGEAVERWRSMHPGYKAWIIAHSNGGLVARWFIEKLGGREFVDRLFLLGAPRDGCPKAMAVLLNGFDTFLRRRLNVLDIPAKTRTALRTFPSIYQLIPSQSSFLQDVFNHPLDPFVHTGWLEDRASNHTRMLEDGRRFNQELGEDIGVETVCMFGRRKPTLSLGIIQFNARDSWHSVEWLAEEPGDGTVPLHSAVYSGADAKYPFSVTHGDIYANPAVLDVLEWELFGKYHMEKRALLTQSHVSVSFDVDKDVYQPGDDIHIKIKAIKEGDTAFSAAQAKAQVQIVWRKAIPGSQPAKLAKAVSHSVRLPENPDKAASFSSALKAPPQEGYYDIHTAVFIKDHPPVLCSELILVEKE